MRSNLRVVFCSSLTTGLLNMSKTEMNRTEATADMIVLITVSCGMLDILSYVTVMLLPALKRRPATKKKKQPPVASVRELGWKPLRRFISYWSR